RTGRDADRAQVREETLPAEGGTPPTASATSGDDGDGLVLNEPKGDPYAKVRSDDAELARAVGESRSHYELARSAFRQGDIDRARDEFDRAVDVLDAGELAGRSEAQALVEAITAKVSDYETAWAQAREQTAAG